MDGPSDTDLERIYYSLETNYDRLGSIVAPVIEEILVDENVDLVQVQDRLKSMESFVGKARRKNYSDPSSQMTDFLGIRVIVLTETHVDLAASVMMDAFDVDAQNSVDKTNPLDLRSFGYRSVHLICSLGERRNRLREYRGLGGLKFEIQIRTVLQHAWAEIEHKLNYKSDRSLPADLQRRLFTTAANLEGVDRELSQIRAASEEYARTVLEKQSALDNTPLSLISLRVIVDEYLNELGVENIKTDKNTPQQMETALNELEKFGVSTVSELLEMTSNLDSKAFKETMIEHPYGNMIGLVRLMMFATDFPRTKEKVMRGGFSLGEHSLKLVKATNQIEDPESLANSDFADEQP